MHLLAVGGIDQCDYRRVSSFGLRTRQLLFVGLGTVLAGVMLMLGLWQAQRSVESGDAGIAARASGSPVVLLDLVHQDGTFGDVYGRPVTVSGTYLQGQQLLIPDASGALRVLSALQVPDGRVVPVVRGTIGVSDALPPAPTGDQTVSGLFLPGEGDTQETPGTVLPGGAGVSPGAEGRLASIRMPLLAQVWTQQLTPGFVTLTASESTAQGLGPATVVLPHGEKSLQNGSYALQWWLFAAFAFGMGIKLAHGLGERERQAVEDAAVSPDDQDAPGDA